MIEIKQYLIETFRFNDHANAQALEKIKQIPEKEDAIKFFSHMINSQDKWMARILQDSTAQERSWWNPFYPLEDLQAEWNRSLKAWLSFLAEKTEEQLFQDVTFIGYDGGKFAAKLKDIALQLNYHSIHHRAQIQYLIRQQGMEPEFVDYIGTVYRKLDS
jgi:uncharacterized damage-inducible protein DinB